MMILGITGGIGSGKSVVSKLLETMGIPIYNSDKEAKKVTANSPLIREKLIRKFGSYLYKGEILDKVAFASLIFNDSSALDYANSVIHPEVLKDFLEWKDFLSHKKIVGIESAILFESRLNQVTDINITILAPEELRIERVIKRDKISKELIEERIKNQLSDEERALLTDYIIYNDNTHALIPQIEKIFSKLNIQ